MIAHELDLSMSRNRHLSLYVRYIVCIQQSLPSPENMGHIFIHRLKHLRIASGAV